MAHFAELDENNFVKQVIVVHNNELLNENGDESEAKGIAFCQALFGIPSRSRTAAPSFGDWCATITLTRY